MEPDQDAPWHRNRGALGPSAPQTALSAPRPRNHIDRARQSTVVQRVQRVHPFAPSDRQLLDGCAALFGQGQFEDPILILRLGLGLIDIVPHRKAAGLAAVVALSLGTVLAIAGCSK